MPRPSSESSRSSEAATATISSISSSSQLSPSLLTGPRKRLAELSTIEALANKRPGSSSLSVLSSSLATSGGRDAQNFRSMYDDDRDDNDDDDNDDDDDDDDDDNDDDDKAAPGVRADHDTGSAEDDDGAALLAVLGASAGRRSVRPSTRASSFSRNGVRQAPSTPSDLSTIATLAAAASAAGNRAPMSQAAQKKAAAAAALAVSAAVSVLSLPAQRVLSVHSKQYHAILRRREKRAGFVEYLKRVRERVRTHNIFCFCKCLYFLLLTLFLSPFDCVLRVISTRRGPFTRCGDCAASAASF
jgi:hypothetical protein